VHTVPGFSMMDKISNQVVGATAMWLAQVYLTEGVYEVILRMLIPAQIRQLILYISNIKNKLTNLGED
jgi:hypothetical protein